MTHDQEAHELLKKHSGVIPSYGGSIDAIKDALRQRDDANEEHNFSLASEAAAIATLTAQRDKAMEALRPFVSNCPDWVTESDKWDIKVKIKRSELAKAASVVKELDGE